MTDRVRELEAQVQRLETLLERSVRLAGERGPAPIGLHALDAMLAVLGTPRGFVGIVDGDGWRLLAARDLTRADLDDPESFVSSTVIARVLTEGRPVLESNAVDGDLGAQASVVALRLRSVICLPITRDGRPLGFVYLDDPRFIGRFDRAAVRVLEGWLPLVAHALHAALEDERARTDSPFPEVVTRSAPLIAELTELRGVAGFDVPVLLTGETGTGKTLLARAIHGASPRARGPFVHVNCGAIPEGLVEGELFGTERGAFTGAQSRAGRFEAARGGTLFLDELDSLPLGAQVKLLLAVQEAAVTRLGANAPIPTDVRLLAAVNTDPAARIAAGQLREDLYYRLAVVDARVPPLRERPEDIPLLAGHLLARIARQHGLPALSLAEPALAALLEHPWPGNVRELENVLQRAAVLSRDGVIRAVRLAGASAARPARVSRPRKDATPREAFLDAWNRSASARECAARLGLTERTVFRLKARYL